MSDSFAFRQFGVSAAAVLALALSACGGGGGGGSPTQLAAAPASEGGAGAPPRAGDGGGGSLPVEERLSVEPGAEEDEPDAPVGEAPGAGGPAAPGGGSASPSGAAWHVFGDVGTGPNGAALVTAEDLAGLSATALNYASNTQPNHDFPDWHSVSQADGLATRFAPSDMTVRVGHNDGGQVSYGLTYNESRGARDNPTYAWEWTFDSETAGTNVRRVSSDGGQGAMFRRETDAGNLWTAVATDISGPGDTDWLATGVWAYAPAGGPGPDTGRDWSRGYRFGVFAGGGEPYGGDLESVARASLVTGLTGAATYEGGASGVWSRRTGATEATRRNDLFSADATLTIDFSAKPPYSEGVATGRIHDMEIGGTPIAGNPEIVLSGGQVFGNGQIDSFGRDGTTRMTFDGVPKAGGVTGWSWGAGLFGDPAPGATGADRLPESVAGTFGAVSGVRAGGRNRRPDGDYVVGAFAAHRTAWTDAPEGVRQNRQP